MNRRSPWLLSLLICAVTALPAAEKNTAPEDDIKVPLGLLPLQWPADNLYSKSKWELGRALYFDRRLSADSSLSCASCHSPKFGFTDGQPNSTGIRGQH